VLANRSTFLFQARPQAAYATQQARQKANSTVGINLPQGDYVLVPQSHTDDLKPYLDKMKLANGYMVPKDASASDSTYETAEKAPPDISYITMNMKVNSLVQMGEPGGPPAPPKSSSSSSSSSSTKKKTTSTSTSGKPQ
jgi:hypothetical protein